MATSNISNISISTNELEGPAAAEAWIPLLFVGMFSLTIIILALIASSMWYVGFRAKHSKGGKVEDSEGPSLENSDADGAA